MTGYAVEIAWNAREEIRAYLTEAKRWNELEEFNEFINFIAAVGLGAEE